VGYLLDEHVSPQVARLLRQRGIEAHALREFGGLSGRTTWAAL
jgi:predicted nuclease of predicted toxin-antitoxin system